MSYSSPIPTPPQLNPEVNPFQRSFVGEIRRIDEMARRVRFFTTQIDKESQQYPTAPVPVRALGDSAPLASVGPRASQTRDELDVVLNEHESRLSQMNDSYNTLSTRQRELVEARHVLRETAVFFDRVRPCVIYYFHNTNVCLLGWHYSA